MVLKAGTHRCQESRLVGQLHRLSNTQQQQISPRHTYSKFPKHRINRRSPALVPGVCRFCKLLRPPCSHLSAVSFSVACVLQPVQHGLLMWGPNKKTTTNL